jgi:DNA adenine methylase
METQLPDLFEMMQSLDDTEVTREGFVRSPLNYMGNKFESLERILPLLPYEDIWVEGFGGSGVVTLNRNPSKLDVFNDRHSGISCFFKSCQTNHQELIARISLMPHSRELFAWCKANVENAQVDEILRGAMWYYLVKCSFSGKCKYFGRSLKTSCVLYNSIFGSLDLLPMVSNRFQKVQIENLDWRQIFKDYDSVNTVWYLDPPYYGANVYEHNMTKDDHYSFCANIFKLKGFVAVSGFSNPDYDAFDWDGRHEFDIRNICVSQVFNENNNLKGSEASLDRNSVRKECLWIKEA